MCDTNSVMSETKSWEGKVKRHGGTLLGRRHSSACPGTLTLENSILEKTQIHKKVLSQLRRRFANLKLLQERFAARQCKSGEPIQRCFKFIRSPVDDSLGWVSEPSSAGLGLPVIFAFGPMELTEQQQQKQQQTLEEENEVQLLQKPMRPTVLIQKWWWEILKSSECILFLFLFLFLFSLSCMVMECFRKKGLNLGVIEWFISIRSNAHGVASHRRAWLGRHFCTRFEFSSHPYDRFLKEIS